MSLPQKVQKYLDKHDIDYEELAHKTVYTAYDAASTLKKELKKIAKNLLVQVDKSYVLIIVPADKRIDLNKIKKAMGAKKVSIPKEKVMIKVLKVKPGVVSSFGKLHKVETMIDKTMAKTKDMVFATGSATDSVMMKVKDFVKMEEAKLADIAMKSNLKIPKKTKAAMKKVIKKKPAKKTAKKKVVKKSAPARGGQARGLRKSAKKPIAKKKVVKRVVKKKK